MLVTASAVRPTKLLMSSSPTSRPRRSPDASHARALSSSVSTRVPSRSKSTALIIEVPFMKVHAPSLRMFGWASGGSASVLLRLCGGSATIAWASRCDGPTDRRRDDHIIVPEPACDGYKRDRKPRRSRRMLWNAKRGKSYRRSKSCLILGNRLPSDIPGVSTAPFWLRFARERCRAERCSCISRLRFRQRLSWCRLSGLQDTGQSAFGLPLISVPLHPFSLENVVRNDENRCYYCKRAGFSAILAEAQARGIEVVVDGSNADDAGDYRLACAPSRSLGCVPRF